jgi:hypothetical protein
MQVGEGWGSTNPQEIVVLTAKRDALERNGGKAQIKVRSTGSPPHGRAVRNCGAAGHRVSSKFEFDQVFAASHRARHAQPRLGEAIAAGIASDAKLEFGTVRGLNTFADDVIVVGIRGSSKVFRVQHIVAGIGGTKDATVGLRERYGECPQVLEAP